jgi:cytochrome d ubiquinol oxidase subunit II
MLFDYETLRVIWWILIGALLIGFAIADGMDLGVGNLLPFLGKRDEERQQIIASIAPHWDGNQVWFITAGGAIFAAWPLVYAAAFSGLYMALLLVLFALFFRPVGFDYRDKVEDPRWRTSWDWALFGASAVPSIVFGVAFGNLFLGLPFHLDEYMRSHYEGFLLTAFLPLLNPFALLCGIISFAMLSTHGAVWLQMRTDGAVQERARKTVRILAPITIIGFAVAGLWIAYGIDGFHIVSQQALDSDSTPLEKVVERAPGGWLANYSLYPITIAAPVIGFVGAILTLLLSMLHRPGKAFLTSALSVAGIIGTAGLSLFPFIMPSRTIPNSSLTIWDATSSHLTLTIMFWVVLFFLPVVLGYTAWCYIRMWGKIRIPDDTHPKQSGY